MKKKKFRISGKLIFNLSVVIISVFLIIYFFVSEDGLIDLLSKPDSFSLIWIIIALVVYDLNILFDTIVTLVYLRSRYPKFRFVDALKVSFVGVFFGAVTPSNTGGQPMQLYLLSKMDVSVGFGSSCMTQKFIVYQVISTVFSIFAVIYKFDYFSSMFTNIWSALFIVLGFAFQISVTTMFFIISFSKKLTHNLITHLGNLMKRLKFVKEPNAKIKRLKKELALFHKGNKELFSKPKMIVEIYILVAIQILAILSVPYFIYISFGMPKVAYDNGVPMASFFDFICVQSFVLFTSNLVPLPGASGGAELAFTMYFGQFFKIGNVNKIKPAILMWRFITYYGAMLISAPFSYFTKGKHADEIKKEIEEKIETDKLP